MWIVSLYEVECHFGIFTIMQLCMFNDMLGIVYMASAICMLTMSVLNASIIIRHNANSYFDILIVSARV